MLVLFVFVRFVKCDQTSSVNINKQTTQHVGDDVASPDALWDLFSRGMMGSLFSRSLSDLDSSSDQGFLFFTFLVPLGAGGFLTLGAPETSCRRRIVDCKPHLYYFTSGSNHLPYSQHHRGWTLPTSDWSVIHKLILDMCWFTRAKINQKTGRL